MWGGFRSGGEERERIGVYTHSVFSFSLTISITAFFKFKYIRAVLLNVSNVLRVLVAQFLLYTQGLVHTTICRSHQKESSRMFGKYFFSRLKFLCQFHVWF